MEIHFTEELKGFQRAQHEAETPVRFVVTVTVPDLHALLDDPATPCVLTGMCIGHTEGGTAWSAPVLDGRFRLFVGNTRTGPARMEYHLACLDPERGTTVTLEGHKDIARRGPFVPLCDTVRNLWRDTTTLFCEWSVDGHPFATGIVRIELVAFLKQLTTFRASGGPAIARARGILQFFGLFARVLWNIYGPRRTRISPHEGGAP